MSRLERWSSVSSRGLETSVLSRWAFHLGKWESRITELQFWIKLRQKLDTSMTEKWLWNKLRNDALDKVLSWLSVKDRQSFGSPSSFSFNQTTWDYTKYLYLDLSGSQQKSEVTNLHTSIWSCCVSSQQKQIWQLSNCEIYNQIPWEVQMINFALLFRPKWSQQERFCSQFTFCKI